ncbi:hypothetical protein [Pseudokineococcus sp. 1T1Z-3]|uniref:hypothetical protein n=1 Tax=Pseudokineococcus sp. 1T1Z-3 TaxID=3132745 RepID=UPI00309807E4
MPVVLLGTLAVLLLVRAAWVVWSRPWRRSQLQQLSVRAQLPLDTADGMPSALAERVGRRLVRREVGSSVGGLLATLAVLLLVLADGGLDEAGGWVEGALTFAVVGLGLTAGTTAVVARDALAPPSLPGVRRARSRAGGLEDYVPWLRLLTGRLLCAVSAGAGVLMAVLATRSGEAVAGAGGLPVSNLVLGGCVAVAWVLTELLARRVVALPQPAGRPLELAWDDVLRARHLRELAFFPCYLACLNLLYLPGEVAGVLGLSQGDHFVVVVVVLLVALAGLMLPGRGQPVERYARYRLWPVTLSADRPGEVEDPALAP